MAIENVTIARRRSKYLSSLHAFASFAWERAHPKLQLGEALWSKQAETRARICSSLNIVGFRLITLTRATQVGNISAEM